MKLSTTLVATATAISLAPTAFAGYMDSCRWPGIHNGGHNVRAQCRRQDGVYQYTNINLNDCVAFSFPSNFYGQAGGWFSNSCNVETCKLLEDGRVFQCTCRPVWPVTVLVSVRIDDFVNNHNGVLTCYGRYGIVA